MIFRGSENGFSTEEFHKRCDHRGPTITIMKSKHYLFGGFTDIPWTNSGGCIQGNGNSFLFKFQKNNLIKILSCLNS